MSDSFTWTSKGGVVVTLPALASVPAGVFRRHRKKNEVDFVFSVLEDLADEAALEAVDSVPLPEMEDLFSAWQADTGASVGESSGSSI